MFNEKYPDWFHLTAAIEYSEDVNHVYEVGKEVWDYKNKRLSELIDRIENLPCCMSCYVTQDELRAAKNMKNWIIEILKGENK